MTVNLSGVPVSLTPTDELNALIDRQRFLEMELSRQMDENDVLLRENAMVRSCLRAADATILELQQAVVKVRAA